MSSLDNINECIYNLLPFNAEVTSNNSFTNKLFYLIHVSTKSHGKLYFKHNLAVSYVHVHTSAEQQF